jgi:DNA-binding NarL/FixJ family response regulator
MERPISVLIVDDHRLLIEGVTSLLASQENIWLAGSAVGAEESLHKLRSGDIDVVLIDANMERAEVLRTIDIVRRESPQTKVLVFGLNDHENEILEFVEGGASAYFLKDAPLSELLKVIDAVHNQQTICSPRMAAYSFDRLMQLSKGSGHAGNHPPLTQREKEILQLIALDLSNKEIAQHLCISLSTVKNHVHNVFEKLQVHYRREAVLLAKDRGEVKGPHSRRSLILVGP